MQVVAPDAGVLTNFEVRQLPRKQVQRRQEAEQLRPLPGARRAAAAAGWRSQQEVADLIEQALEYLDETACAAQSRESIGQFLAAVKPFELTRAETLMLVNSQPSSLVEIHLIVEECEERLTLEQRHELLGHCAALASAGAAT